MLAQSFLPAADLGITDPQRDALMKTLVLLETGKLKHTLPDCTYREPQGFTGHFNMAWWDLDSGCGTICCIGGTAELVGNLSSDSLGRKSRDNRELQNLFYPGKFRRDHRIPLMVAITPAQAATALRSYLSTGDAKWHEAVSG